MAIDKNTEDVALSTKSASQRIIALDIIRGFFLVLILIDHIELYPSGFDYFTGRGRMLVSAAEGFFFMSGLLVGMVYRRRLILGLKFIFKRMWKRALELYIASIFFSLFFTAAAVLTNHQGIKYGLYSVIDWPHIIKETVLMRYGFGWADFLDRFAILMFMAPFSFYLLAKRKWWLLAGLSFIAWCFRGNEFTLSWQLLFNLAMIVGFYWHQLTAKWHGLGQSDRGRLKRSIYGVTAVTFAFSYGSVYALSILNEKLLSLPHWLYSLTLHWNSLNAWVWLYSQKWTMGPFRLVLFMFWFATFFMFVQRYQTGINRRTRGVIELLGRNSLLVYIVHAFVVFVFKFFIPDTTNFLDNFLFTAGALIALVAVTYGYKRIESDINRSLKNLFSTLKKPLLSFGR